jgi:triacylglycerol lipase
VGERLEQLLAVLNGLVGHHLVASSNGLATRMAFYREGLALAPTADAWAAAYAGSSPRVVVLVHGVMCTETIWRMADGSDYGALLQRDHRFTPLYVRYNSGQSLSESGRQLSLLLEELCQLYPVPIEEIVLLGYSMGGLVVRAACHIGEVEKRRWLSEVKRAIYLGTPHLGAPAERLGRATSWLLRAIGNPYTRLIAEVGDLRSDGLKDLGHAALRTEDRVLGHALASLWNRDHPVPLSGGLEHHLIAGVSDVVVPLSSASHGKAFPRSTTVVPGVGHLDLPRHPMVYARISEICGAPR